MAEGFEFGDEPLGFFRRVRAVGVEVGAEIGVGLAGGQHVPDDYGEGVGDGDDGPFFGGGVAVAAESQHQPVVSGFEPPAGADRGPGAFHQQGLQVGQEVFKQSMETVPGWWQILRGIIRSLSELAGCLIDLRKITKYSQRERIMSRPPMVHDL